MMRTLRTLATLGLVTAIAGLGTSVIAAPQFASKSGDNKPETQQVKVGEKVPDFTLTDLDGKQHSLSDYKGKTIVLEWTNPDCPYIRGVYQKGIVKSTLAKMKDMGDDYVYLAINSTAQRMSRDDVIKQNKAFLKENKINIPVLIDYDGKVGRMFGAKHTPDMYVIDSDMALRYFGGYTDDPGFRNIDDCMNYVVNALEQIKAGETVAPDTARRWGCGVKYARR